MRTERNKDSSWNVWLSRNEYEVLPREAETFEQEVAIRLMGDCGLRVQEVLDVKPKHVSRLSDGTHFELKVVGGKDTTGEYTERKYRETWPPRDVEQRSTATSSRLTLMMTNASFHVRNVPSSTGLRKQLKEQPKKRETTTINGSQPTISADVGPTICLLSRISVPGSSWLLEAGIPTTLSSRISLRRPKRTSSNQCEPHCSDTVWQVV